MPFTVEEGKNYEALQLKMRYDDGFIAYLNGTEILRVNAPDQASWDSTATRSNSDRNAEIFEPFLLAEHVNLLNPGENVLAIHA